MSFPYLRVIGGVLLILAGVFAYYGVSVGPPAALIFLLGGVLVVVISVSGHRPRPIDAGVFVIGLLALSGIAIGYNPSYGSSQTLHYSATPAQIPDNSLFLTVSASTGSVKVSFTNDANLAYAVTFARPASPIPFVPPGPAAVANSTRGGTYFLNVTSGAWAVSILLNSRYSTGMTVSTDTGSVSLDATGNESLTDVSLWTSTGSVNAMVDSPSILGLNLTTETGSVSLTSHHLGAGGRHVPVLLTANTGSVSISATLSAGAATVSASTDLGMVSHQLSGFTVMQSSPRTLEAAYGDSTSARDSFVITAQTNLGSVDVTLDTASP